MKSSKKYDVVVVGAGHAGIEASLAAARMGSATLLITMDKNAIGRMSCNPAIGGSAKGHLVREIDALGGEMGIIADSTGMHFKMLNKSKGPAIWSPRCQNDREWYSREARSRLEKQEKLEIIEDCIEDISIIGGAITGVVTKNGMAIYTDALVLCSGTFLNSRMHTGKFSVEGGRFGEPSSIGLTQKLKSAGFVSGRLKTGTPPRIDKSTIDFASTEPQYSDIPPIPFSHKTTRIENELIPMYLTYTNEKTHDVLKLGFKDSPMFTGRINATGPRYCPSIEDKINRFSDRPRHQIFLEPEGYTDNIVYVNGFSTSLPEEIQKEAIKTVPGLENCKIIRPGYAVEYDYFPPHQLEHTLETKIIRGLFFAGQINGTSGYEEAAAQGLVAGINAALKSKRRDPFVLGRSESYIGVMIDDLINQSTDEPYRIFTSRAEYRLLLRQDNADSRLMRKGYELGLIESSSILRLEKKEKRVIDGKEWLKKEFLVPLQINDFLVRNGSKPIDENTTIYSLLKRPELELKDILSLECISQSPVRTTLLNDQESLERLQIEAKYQGYIRRQEEQILQLRNAEEIRIPLDFNFSSGRSLSNEGREKLNRVRPRSIGQASRISGVTSADLSVLMVLLKK